MDRQPTYRQIGKITYPILIALVAQNLMVVIDTAFLGRVGEIALGSVAIGGLFYMVVVMLMYGFGTGIQILIGRRNGEQNYTQVGRIVDHSIFLLLLFAAVLFAFLQTMAPGFLDNAMQSDQVREGALEFLNVRSWGLFIAVINVLLRSFYIGITRTTVLTLSTTIMAVFNIIFDYLLIFGNAGFPEMGVEGAALATVLAEAITAVFFISYTILSKGLHKFRLFSFNKLEVPIAGRIFKLSWPLIIQNFFAFGGWFTFFLIIEQMGEHDLAISNVVRSVYFFAMIPILGLSFSTNSLVSNVLGAGGGKKDVFQLLKKLLVMSLAGTAILISVLLIFPGPVARIYSPDAQLVLDIIPVLRVLCVGLFFFSIGTILFNTVSGTGNTLFSLAAEIVAIFVYLLVAYTVAIVFKAEIHKVWLMEGVYFVVVGIISYLYLRSGKWMNVRL